MSTPVKLRLYCSICARNDFYMDRIRAVADGLGLDYTLEKITDDDVIDRMDLLIPCLYAYCPGCRVLNEQVTSEHPETLCTPALEIMMLIFCLFFRGNHNKRIIFLLCTLTLLFPIVTKLFTFDATKQRWTFVYIIALICLCIYTLDDITEHTDHIPLKRWLLISDVIILLLLALVFGFSVTGRIAISKRAFVKVIFILFLYNMVFIAMVKKSRQFAALSLLLVVCLDIALETYPIANTRTAIIKENYETSLYNDGTKEAAADIQSKDLGLYRITMHFPMTVTISWVLNRKHML